MTGDAPLVLVLGRSGQLARALVRQAPDAGLQAKAVGRETLDLANREADIAGLLTSARPSFVVNASGWTAVDKAETEPEGARALNATAPGRIAVACAAAGVPLVHVSTDYVFSGRAGGAPFGEADAVAPLGVYAATKAEGEALVQAAGGRAVTLRTSWVYDAEGANFVRTMLRLAATREEVSVVDDQRGAPTWAVELADACLMAGQALAQGALSDAPALHASGAGDTTWAGFAEAIFALSAARGGPSARVRPITTAAFAAPAPRPADGRLDTRLIAARLGWRARPWRDALALCLGEIAAAERWRAGAGAGVAA